MKKVYGSIRNQIGPRFDSAQRHCGINGLKRIFEIKAWLSGTAVARKSNKTDHENFSK